jgi:hypothetical protein
MAVVQDTIHDETGEDVTIYIEVADQSASTVNPYSDTRGPQELVHESFKKTTDLIHVFAKGVANAIHKIPTDVKPKEYEVQFSVKIDAKLGAMIAQSSTEAQIQVTLKWGEKDA